MTHSTETEIALYSSRDLPVVRQIVVGWHVKRCANCRARLESYHAVRSGLRTLESELPEGVDWDRLSIEMAANIHLGLEAGECVAEKKKALRGFHGWRPIAVVAGLIALFGGAWWVNMPEQDTQVIGHALANALRFHPSLADERGPVVETSASGVELRMNGSSMAVTRGASRLVDVSASAGGAARARYVDDDTGQMTIATVYAQ